MTTALFIPVGTQIVLLIDAKVSGESRQQPKGSVAVVKIQPLDVEHSYIVEFPDGTTAAVKRKEFSIRKHFQTESAIGLPAHDELYEYVIYRCVVGSKAFGLDDENSDTDLRGIYLAPADLQWSLNELPEQLENKDNEECYWELKKFLLLALKANPNILECLSTPMVLHSNEIAEELLAMREVFLSKLVYQTYNGYVMSQFKKLEQDLRAVGEVRWKHAMHLIRLLLQGVDILRNGSLQVDVGKDREQLLAIKRGEMQWDAVDKWRLELHKNFEEAFAETKLPERPDYEKANDFLIRARRKMVE